VRKLIEEEAPPGEDWLQTYADAITLLMAFFVMMFSVSKMDQAKYEMIRDSIHENMGHRVEQTHWEQVGRRAEDTNPKPRSTEGVLAKMEKVLQPLKVDGVVQVAQSAEGLIIDMPATMLYPEGGVALSKEAQRIIGQLGWTLRLTDYKGTEIVVEGHTDDVPTSGGLYPSNWEISAARASNVVKFLGQQGVDSSRMVVEAYADTKPKLSNRDENGTAIPENQSANRRVVIKVKRP
jgi:chemotaxis protein MotB